MWHGLRPQRTIFAAALGGALVALPCVLEGQPQSRLLAVLEAGGELHGHQDGAAAALGHTAGNLRAWRQFLSKSVDGSEFLVHHLHMTENICLC